MSLATASSTTSAPHVRILDPDRALYSIHEHHLDHHEPPLISTACDSACANQLPQLADSIARHSSTLHSSTTPTFAHGYYRLLPRCPLLLCRPARQSARPYPLKVVQGLELPLLHPLRCHRSPAISLISRTSIWMRYPVCHHPFLSPPAPATASSSKPPSPPSPVAEALCIPTSAS